MEKIKSIKEAGYKRLKDDALLALDELLILGIFNGKVLTGDESEKFRDAIGKLHQRDKAIEMS